MSVILEPGDWIHIALPLSSQHVDRLGIPNMTEINRVSQEVTDKYNAMGVWILNVSHHSGLTVPTIVSVVRGSGKTPSP